MTSLRIKILLILLPILLLGIAPQPAQAWELSDIGSFTSGAIFGTIDVVLNFLIRLVVDGLTWLAKLLQGVVYLKLSTGGSPVYTVWKLMQSFANMGFIIALILMAFGTIFDTFKLPFVGAYSVHQRGVIPGFLIAALVLNFSLAIGQVVTETSNQLSSILLNTLQFNNINDTIMGRLGVASIALEASSPQPIAIIDNVPEIGLTGVQKAQLAKWPASATTIFNECIKANNAPVNVCYANAVGEANKRLKESEAQAQANRGPEVIFSLQALWELGTGGNYAQTVMNAQPLNTVHGKSASSAALISIEKLYRLFMLTVLFVSFLVVFLFMLVRIPFIWILLAVSPLAWASRAFPGSTLFWDWWKQFWAWQVFSPLYILVIGIGMFAINNIGGLVASMDASGSPLVSGYLATTLAYLLVGVIFIGGSAAALKMSQVGGTYAGTALGNITAALGFDKEYGAFAPAARLTGLRAGYESLTATTVARGEKLKQVAKSITDRSPAVQAFRFKSYDEKLATARKRAGVAGGAKEYADLKQKQITAEQENLKKMLPLQNFKEYKNSVGKTISVKDQENTWLVNRSRDANRDVALAAREELLKRGELQKKPEDLEETKKMYAKIGAEKGFQDRIRRAPGAAALEKKKESEARRDDIIATVSAEKLENAQEVEKILAPYEEKDPQGKRVSEADYRAAVTAVSNKAPAQLFEHLRNQNPTLPEEAVRLQAFSSVFKDTKKIGDLDAKYLDPNTREYAELKKAIDNRWPTSGPNKTKNAGQSKGKAKQAVISAHPEKILEIERLFS